LSIHDLIKLRNFTCVSAVSRGILSVLPQWLVEFAKFTANL